MEDVSVLKIQLLASGRLTEDISGLACIVRTSQHWTLIKLSRPERLEDSTECGEVVCENKPWSSVVFALVHRR